MFREARDRGALSPLDIQFSTRLAALYEEARPPVVWALALACRHEAQGHVCVDLARLAHEGISVDNGRSDEFVRALPEATELDDWLTQLRSSSAVENRSVRANEDGVAVDATRRGDAPRPLVLDSTGRLYLRRSFEDQRRLAAAVRQRAARASFVIDEAWLSSALRRLAADATARDALVKGMLRPLTIVTGGPGTGKTTLMARLIALVVEQRLASGQPTPKIRLLAPTGKAAAAMSNSFQRQRDELDVSDAVKAGLPSHAETIHRVVMRQTRTDALGETNFQPLDDDILVVDEASMVDLALMRQLFEMGQDAERILLLGDPDQLASVDAGAVLGELCEAAEKSRVSTSNAGGQGARAERVPRLDDSWVKLTESHRFAAGGAIGRLAEAIRSGDEEGVIALLDDPGVPEVHRQPADSIPTVQASLVQSALELQEAILASNEPGRNSLGWRRTGYCVPTELGRSA